MKKLDSDKKFSGTFKRLKIKEVNEKNLIENLNGFYSILFTYLRDGNEKEIINDFNFIPNERKEYKKLNYVYCNKDIDNDIKEIYSYLDKNTVFFGI